MNRRADVHRRIGAIQRLYRFGKDVIAGHVTGAQGQAVGYDSVKQERHRHAGKQR